MTQIIKVKQTLCIWEKNRTLELKSSWITVYIHQINGVAAQHVLQSGSVSSNWSHFYMQTLTYWFLFYSFQSFNDWFLLIKKSQFWYGDIKKNCSQSILRCAYFISWNPYIVRVRQILNLYCGNVETTWYILSFQVV